MAQQLGDRPARGRWAQSQQACSVRASTLLQQPQQHQDGQDGQGLPGPYGQAAAKEEEEGKEDELAAGMGGHCGGGAEGAVSRGGTGGCRSWVEGKTGAAAGAAASVVGRNEAEAEVEAVLAFLEGLVLHADPDFLEGPLRAAGAVA